MIELVEKNKCTACGNCQLACSKNAITFCEDPLDNIYPIINCEKCVQCGMCRNACPEINDVEKNKANDCYACYSTKSETRDSSASGGMAASVYQFCLNNEIPFSGVYFDNETLEARFEIGYECSDIEKFQNSKYTFSYMNDICIQIAAQLESGKETLFIGLPCQIAAVKQWLVSKRKDTTNLITVDIVCHGVPSAEYLKKHIQDTLHVNKVDRLSFRDRKRKTSKFVFSVAYGGKEYHKHVESNDNYQIGYHNATIYRPNCYQCNYANKNRIGDLTIGDFTGLGKGGAYEGNIAEDKYLGTSCVLLNSRKGKEFFNAIVEKKLLHVQKRPLDEAFLYENQLKKPSTPSKYRADFEKMYPKDGFTKTCNKIFASEKIKRPLVKSVKILIKKILGRK